MKTVHEMIQIMQAYEEGAQIQIKPIDTTEWADTSNPWWNWSDFDYRVKPKKSYVPFETPEEFLAAQRKHGCELITIEDGEKKKHYVSVTLDGNVFEHKIENRISNCTYLGDLEDLLLGDYKFEDCTPCGKEVQL